MQLTCLALAPPGFPHLYGNFNPSQGIKEVIDLWSSSCSPFGFLWWGLYSWWKTCFLYGNVSQMGTTYWETTHLFITNDKYQFKSAYFVEAVHLCICFTGHLLCSRHIVNSGEQWWVKPGMEFRIQWERQMVIT